jgi:anti-sigma-K factor RskA
MRYTDPRLRNLLAGEYVMGRLPPLARARFERLLADDAALARIVAQWAERLAPLDAGIQAVEPPARVWRAIERAVGPAPSAIAAPRPAPRSWWDWLPLWRGFGFGGLAVAAALLLFVALRPPPVPAVVAVLADQAGAPSWIATRIGAGEIAVVAVRPQPLAAGRSFQLWSIAGGAPKPLGLLAATPEKPLVLAAAEIPADGALAVSLEPEGGSPTGLPTGPVLYQGKVLPR